MKFKICLTTFTIILFINIYQMKCRPYPMDSDYDIVGKCMGEIGCNKKSIDGLNNTIADNLKMRLNLKIMHLKIRIQRMKRLRKEIGLENKTWKYELLLNFTKMNHKLNLTEHNYKMERENRLFFQSIISMDDYTDELFINHWPEWAPNKPTAKYSPYHWEILLSNVEDDEIFSIRKKMVKLKVNVTTFIKTAQRLRKLRNVKVHDPQIEAKDKLDAYDYFNRTREVAAEKSVIEVLLLPGEKAPEDDQITKSVLTSANDARRKYILLKIPKYDSDEEYFGKELMKTCNQRNIKPTGFAIVEDTAYATFENFQDTYYVWNERRDAPDVPEEQTKEMVILPMKTKLKPPYPAFVNLTIQRKELGDAHDSILKEFAKSALRNPQSIKTYTKKMLNEKLQNNDNITIFYQFSCAAPAIQFYSICKNMKKGEPKLLMWYQNQKDLARYEISAAAIRK